MINVYVIYATSYKQENPEYEFNKLIECYNNFEGEEASPINILNMRTVLKKINAMSLHFGYKIQGLKNFQWYK